MKVSPISAVPGFLIAALYLVSESINQHGQAKGGRVYGEKEFPNMQTNVPIIHADHQPVPHNFHF